MAVTEEQVGELLKKVTPYRFACIVAIILVLTAYSVLDNYDFDSLPIYLFNVLTLILYLPICVGKILYSAKKVADNPNLDGKDLLITSVETFPYIVIVMVTSIYMWYATYYIYIMHFK